jgi:uncharacterized membrane-anchored protein YitT (DUF2179 family)
MGKRGNFVMVFFMILLLVFGNVFLYMRNAKITLSGFSVADASSKLKNPDFYTVSFIVQWVLILIIVLIFYVKFIKKRKKEEKTNVIKVERERGDGKAHTSLDDLYNLLKERKNLKLSTIARSFNIDKDTALAWCKILEEHDIATIEYPAFSEPEVVLK